LIWLNSILPEVIESKSFISRSIDAFQARNSGCQIALSRTAMTQGRINRYSQDEKVPPESILFGRTGAMAALRRSLLKVAETNIPVLIEGESGTGKEIICKYLHQRSMWGCGPLVRVSCPAIPGTLLESELFGYEHQDLVAFGSKVGRENGTLFLDEISELDRSLQSKLLHLMRDGRLVAIGSSIESNVNPRRIICATNRPLQQEVAQGRFRQDLYNQITGLVLRLPPLRERLEDLGAFVNYFIALYNERFKCRAPQVSESSLLLMRSHPWKGNIRELENLIKRYVVLGTEEAILGEIRHYNSAACGAEIAPETTVSLSELTRAALCDLEGRIILNALSANQWNRKRTALSLKISYRSLLYKLKKAGIENRRDYGSVKTEQNTLRNLQ
jgi:two-component system response regulator AtoC